MEKTVLLVDDDLVLRDVVQDVLEAEGYDVVPASDGHQALEFLRTSEGSADAPALMILDLKMPIVDGWQVLDALKNDPSLKVPTIVVSATGPEPRDGVDKYLQKPLDLVELLETVHKKC
jgi:two-component system chemotaxis response regulator CheY